jgi:hypothetical protein
VGESKLKVDFLDTAGDDQVTIAIGPLAVPASTVGFSGHRRPLSRPPSLMMRYLQEQRIIGFIIGWLGREQNRRVGPVLAAYGPLKILNYGTTFSTSQLAVYSNSAGQSYLKEWWANRGLPQWERGLTLTRKRLPKCRVLLVFFNHFFSNKC